jgi:sporulation protein YlmC with PRC-barrel domain
MRNRIIFLIVLLTAVLGGTLFASGQQQRGIRDSGTGEFAAADVTRPDVPRETLIRGTSLLGKTVVQKGTGKVIGRVEDIMYDLSDGYTPYLVITADGLEEFGEEDRLPLPLYMISDATEGDEISLLSEDVQPLTRVLPIEEFEDTRVTGIAWTQRYYPYWQNIVPAEREAIQPRMQELRRYRFSYGFGRRYAPTYTLRQSVLLGEPVRTPEGTAVAEIVDTVISLKSGGFYYLVLAPREDSGLTEDHYTVPLNGFTLNTREDIVIFSHPINVLSRAPGFGEKWPSSGNPEWSGSVEQYWNRVGFGMEMRMGMRIVPLNLVEAETLIGISVSNHMYENIGQIEDLMVNRNDDTVSYAAVEFGGLFETADRRTLIPLNAVSMNNVYDLGYVNLMQDEVENAPSFREGTVPDTDMFIAWDNEVTQYWNSVFYGDTAPSAARGIETVDRPDMLERPQALPLTVLLEFSLINSSGEVIGEVDRLLMDMETRKIGWSVITLNAGIGGEDVVVPFSVMLWDASNGSFMASVEESVIEDAPRFAEMSDTRETGWRENMRQYWNDYTQNEYAYYTLK